MISAFNEEKLKGRGSNIAISSVCNSNCIFCSNCQNPFKIKRVGFISREDFLKQLFYIKYNQPPSDQISLSDVLPGTISEGEALLHPEFPLFVSDIRKHLPNSVRINITTNGGLLTQEVIDFLGANNPVDVSISIPSFSKEIWLKMFGVTNERLYETAVSSFTKLKNVGVNISASVVPLPAMTGWDDLELTIKTLKEVGVNIITVWYPGYTKHTPNKEFLDIVQSVPLSDLHDFFRKASIRHKVYIREFGPFIDKNYAQQGHYKRIDEIFSLAVQNGAKRILWATSVAAHDFVKEEIEYVSLKYPSIIENNIISIENKMYGGNIASAGLLTVSDVVESISMYKNSYDLFVLPPHAFLNRIGEDIVGDSFFKIEEMLGDVPYLFV
jgi:molybdenum cofactor biosynthesis enzyme MoaA